MKIELLYSGNCPAYRQAYDQVEGILAEEGLDAHIEMIEVTSAQEAEKLKFPGSPTIRIDGADVEPSARVSTSYGLMCRIYITESGISEFPPIDMIRTAVRKAKAED